MSFKLNPKEGVDYLTLDYEGFRQMMIDRLKEKLPEYTDYSETDMGIVLIELTAHGLDILSYYKDRQALECFLPTARERKNVIMHCKLFGYTLDSAIPSKFIQVFETDGSGFRVNDGDLVRVKTKEEQGQPSVFFEIIGSLTPSGEFLPTFEIPSGQSGLEMLNGEYVHRAVIVQGLTIPKEVVGYSDGTASQKFTTGYSPALDYTPEAPYNEDVIHVYVTENGTSVEWTRVESFLLASSVSKCYTYSTNEYGEGIVEFGNGVSGAIPPKNAKIETTYRVGGGIETNVGANTIVEMENKPASVIRTFNPDTAFILGSDAESIESAKVKAPASLRSLDRAVTTKDYEDIGLVIDFITSAQSAYYDSDGTGTVFIMDGDDNILQELVAGQGGFNEAVEYGGYIRVWLVPNKVEADPENPNIVYISEDNMKYLYNPTTKPQSGYYYERKMIGQKIEVNPAKIKYIVPTIKITKDVNYTDETVINAVKGRLIELMKLGNYQLKEDLIWSDLVRNLVDSSTGVTGLRSATFVQRVEGTTNKFYIADDLPSELGTIFALQPKTNADKEDLYPYEIDIILE